MENLVKLQRQYFNSNATKPVDFRIAQLKKLNNLIESNEAQLRAAIHQDYGKQEFEAFLSENHKNRSQLFLLDLLPRARRGLVRVSN
jgi:acyl-CoA reductase-like NAD-dependent aldehyde dehydrogenase